MKRLTEHVIPRIAAQQQKSIMYRCWRKPRDMKMRTFMGRVTEINDHLPNMPPFDQNQKLTDYELKDLGGYAVPSSWQRKLVEFNFHPTEHSVVELVEFCERIEQAEPEEAKPEPHSTSGPGPKSDAKPAGNSKKYKKKNKHSKAEGSGVDTSKWCALQQVHGHDTVECKVVLDQVKNMRGMWDSKRSGDTGGHKGSKRFSWKEKESQKSGGHEMRTMVAEYVKEALKNNPHKRRKTNKEQLAMSKFCEDSDSDSSDSS